MVVLSDLEYELRKDILPNQITLLAENQRGTPAPKRNRTQMMRSLSTMGMGNNPLIFKTRLGNFNCLEGNIRTGIAQELQNNDHEITLDGVRMIIPAIKNFTVKLVTNYLWDDVSKDDRDAMRYHLNKMHVDFTENSIRNSLRYDVTHYLEQRGLKFKKYKDDTAIHGDLIQLLRNKYFFTRVEAKSALISMYNIGGAFKHPNVLELQHKGIIGDHLARTLSRPIFIREHNTLLPLMETLHEDGWLFGQIEDILLKTSKVKDASSYTEAFKIKLAQTNPVRKLGIELSRKHFFKFRQTATNEGITQRTLIERMIDDSP